MNKQIVKNKLLIVIPSLTLGGAEKQAFEYAIALKKLGVTPIVLGLGREGGLVEKLKGENIHYLTYSFSSFFSSNKLKQLFFLVRFTLFLRTLKCNQVITFTYWPNVILKLVHRFAGIKIMFWNQRSVDDKLPILFWEKIAKFFKVNYIANSQASANSIIKRYTLKQSDVSIILNVMELSKELMPPTKHSATIDLIMVANFFEEKDHFTVLKAFARLKKINVSKKIKLHLVGSAPGKSTRLIASKSLAFDLGLTPNDILFYDSYSNVKSLLKNMDIGILSTYSEGFSNAIMEYMDAGLPVVASDIPANREALGEMNMSYLFELENAEQLCDKINYLLNNQEVVEQLRKDNFSRAQDLFHRRNLEIKLKHLIIEPGI